MTTKKRTITAVHVHVRCLTTPDLQLFVCSIVATLKTTIHFQEDKILEWL